MATIDADGLLAAANALIAAAKKIKNKNGLEIEVNYSVDEAEAAICAIIGRKFGEPVTPGDIA